MCVMCSFPCSFFPCVHIETRKVYQIDTISNTLGPTCLREDKVYQIDTNSNTLGPIYLREYFSLNTEGILFELEQLASKF